MAAAQAELAHNGGKDLYVAVVELLDAGQVARSIPSSAMEVHDFITQGLPASAVQRLAERVSFLKNPATLAKILNMSERTIQRFKNEPTKRLDLDASMRVWNVAEIRMKAADVLGSPEKADAWLTSPAMALDQKRPIDLMKTSQGHQIVEDLLNRMDYGVYT